MAKLHVWPQDAQGHPAKPHYFNWSMSPFGLVGEHSTLGYYGVGLTVDHARWMGMEFDEVELHEQTSSQEAAAARALLHEHEAQA